MAAPSWEFTINNYTKKHVALLESWSDDVKFIRASHEVGAKGTPHLQGRVVFRRNYRLTQLKKLIPSAHWEKTKAGSDCLYVVKEGSEVLINVDNRQQGKRSDLAEAIDAIKGGATPAQMWAEHTSAMVRYSKGLMEAHAVLGAKGLSSTYTEVRWPLQTDFSKSIVISGAPGIGKTEYAKQHFQRALFVTHMDDLLGLVPGVHDGIVFDDMDFLHLPRTTQIHLVDMDNPRTIHCRYKGALIPANTPKIFTTNNEEGRVFDLDDGAIQRRVRVVVL